MTAEKIANRQLFYILFMMRTTVIIAFLPVITTADALQDAWLSAILSFVGAALLVILIGGLGTRFPDLTLVEFGERLLGTWPGRLVSLIPLWAFLHLASTDVRTYSEMLITSFLTETPLFFITLFMVIAGAWAAFAGIETIGRLADLFFPLFLLMILTSIAMPIPQIEELTPHLRPVLERGMAPVLRGAVTPIAIVSQFLVLGFLIPSANEPKRATRSALWALGASSVVLVAVTLVTTAVLGADKANRTIFPFFAMVQSVQLSEFVERIEVLAIFAWGFGLFITVSVSLFCGSRGMAQVLGLKTYRPLVWPFAVIWTVLAVHDYQDIFQLQTFFQPQIFGPYAIGGWVLLPYGLLWSAYLLKKLAGRLRGGP